MRRASDFGAVLENVVFDSVTRVVDFDDGSNTEKYSSELSRGLMIVDSSEFGVFLVYPDEFDQVFDAEVGERHDTVVSDAKDPDKAVLRVHSIGNVPQPVLVFAKIPCNATDRGDGMNFVDVHGYAA
jgi:hypothetical protein